MPGCDDPSAGEDAPTSAGVSASSPACEPASEVAAASASAAPAGARDGSDVSVPVVCSSGLLRSKLSAPRLSGTLRLLPDSATQWHRGSTMLTTATATGSIRSCNTTSLSGGPGKLGFGSKFEKRDLYRVKALVAAKRTSTFTAIFNWNPTATMERKRNA